MATPSASGIRARTTLMEMAVGAGYPIEKALSYYPEVTGLSVEAKFIYTNSAGFTPDDDMSIAINGRFVYDTRKRITTFPTAPLIRGSYRVGDWVEVFTFDASRTGVAHIAWKIALTYKEGLPTIIAGGSTDRWSLAGSGVRADYYPNGSFLIPPPSNWPRPNFLPLKYHAPAAASRSLANPTQNPIFNQ